MAQFCAKCSKKLHAFSILPLTLEDDFVLCNNCASPIAEKISALYIAKTETELFEQKDVILKISKQFYDESLYSIVHKTVENITFQIHKNNQEFAASNAAEAMRVKIANHMLTTGYDFRGYEITKYLKVISGQVVLGTGFLSEFTASFADFFGAESNQFAEKLEDAKNAAIEKLIINSIEKGGNAIIGVDFDYITFHANMIGVVANGTSVVVEKITTP